MRLRLLMLSACLCAMPTHAAGPSGGTVSAGSATITQSAAQTTVKQTSNKAVVNWNNFSIGSGSTVRFVQPSASSIALNRVTGSQASVIQGALQANGQVWVLNPNGVLIAPGGQVAASSFLATTRSLTDQQFMAGNYAFTDGGVLGASVVNQGSIIVAEGGYAVLAGEAVRNEGYIEANLGQVVLGGAKAFTLDLSGDNTLAFVVTAPVDVTPTDGKAVVDNSGSIQAAGGRVLMTARAASQVVGQVINTGGVVAATSAQMVNGKIVLDGGAGSVSVAGDLNASGKGAGQTGGAIDVNAQKIQIKATAKLDVSGDAGGGKIAIGGGGPNTRTQSFTPAVSTTIAAGARFDASALTRGDGGEILVFTDLKNPLAFTQVAGSFIARGGSQGGNGGFVETSGYRLDVNGIVVNTLAPKGRAGLWLLDPDEIVIGDGVAPLSCVIPACTFITVATINTNLTTGPVSYTAANGDITINAGAPPIAWNNANSFNLTATKGSIFVGRQISSTGSGSVTLSAGTGIEVGAGAAISLSTGNLNIQGNTTGTNSEIKIGSSLTGADITIEGGPAGVVRLNNAVTASGTLTVQAATIAINAAVSAVNSVTLQGSGGVDPAISLNVGAGGSITTTNVAAGGVTIKATSVTLGGSITASGTLSVQAAILAINAAVSADGAITLNGPEGALADSVNVGLGGSIRTINIGGSGVTINAQSVTLGGSITATGEIGITASTSISVGANLSGGSDITLDAGTGTIGFTSTVSTNRTTTLRASTISFGGVGSFGTSAGDLTIGQALGLTTTLTASSTVILGAANITLESPLAWDGFGLKLQTIAVPLPAPPGNIFVAAGVSGSGGASLNIPDATLNNNLAGAISLNGTTPSKPSVFKYQGVERPTGSYGSLGFEVLVTVTNTADAAGGGGDTPAVVAPVVSVTNTAAVAAAAKAVADAAAAKTAADAAAAKAVADAATANAQATAKVVVDQALNQAIATVVASTSAAVFVAPPPAPPATTTTSSASTTTSTDTTAVSSSSTTTVTATTTATTTTSPTTATTTAAASTAQSTVATQEFVEPLSATTLSSTTSAISDPGDASAATTSTTPGSASQTATPVSTVAAAPSAPALTPVAVSKDGADAGDFTLQTVKPPAPVTTAKQEARPAERVTITPVSSGIALQATQKTPAPSGSVLGREISGSGNSSNW